MTIRRPSLETKEGGHSGAGQAFENSVFHPAIKPQKVRRVSKPRTNMQNNPNNSEKYLAPSRQLPVLKTWQRPLLTRITTVCPQGSAERSGPDCTTKLCRAG